MNMSFEARLTAVRWSKESEVVAIGRFEGTYYAVAGRVQVDLSLELPLSVDAIPVLGSHHLLHITVREIPS